ncbi:aldo/keto reductase [Enterococcus sp. AZ109]|uniref:aldo/keto reductase n=1 Tax=Enterococcus sp. AZ109 TaxID=2774634 RepID=UPI003F219F4D
MTIDLGDKKVAAIGLGTWHMGEKIAKRQQEIAALQAGIDAGAQVIDTAEMYGEGRSEQLVGEAIAPYDRSKLYLISKFYPWHADKENLQRSLAQSLARLQTDYLDLYLLHWPGSIPLEETIAELERMKKAGLIRQWGVSNFDTNEMQHLFSVPEGKNCITNQVLYNLASRGIEYELLPWMREEKLPLIAYSPIAQGDTLGGKLLDNPLLKEIAATHQATIFQILLAWVIRDGKTIAIPQSGNAQHVLDNLQAWEIQLTPSEYEQLNQVFPEPTSKQPLDIL